MAETISEERALAVAQKFMKSNRSKHRNLVRWNGIRQNTNDGKYRSQEPYYIFTNSDSIGFVIVAGDDLARPIWVILQMLVWVIRIISPWVCRTGLMT